MSLALTVAIFFVVWWLVFLASLPFGVKSPAETGETLVPGQSHGAPARPRFVAKIIWTTAISLVITALAFANAHYGWIGFEDLPGPKTFY